MPKGFITITVDDKAVKEALALCDKRCKDQTPVWKQIGELMQLSKEETFAAQGRPERWQPLAWATLYGRMSKHRTPGKTHQVFKAGGAFTARAERIMSMHRILQRTGHLKNTIWTKTTATSAAIGSNVVYAAIHQFGGQAGKGRKVTIPARPYLVVQDQDLDAAEQLIVAYATAPLAPGPALQPPLRARPMGT